jgi:hypothetical protein
MTMKQVGRRVAAIEAQAAARRPVDCATCRTWCSYVLIDDAGCVSEPEDCPDCGRHVPHLRRYHIVGIPVKAL